MQDLLSPSFRMVVAGLTVGALIAAGCGGSPPAPAEDAAESLADPSTAATISGRVRLEGPPPTPMTVRLSGDPGCIELNSSPDRPADDLLVGDGGTVEYAFVYVKDGVRQRLYPVPREPVVLDQLACRYVPRVAGVQVGQPVTIRNSDALLHNVRSLSAINEPFDIGQPVQGMTTTRTFTTREMMVPFTCNVHPWMSAYLGVLDHPYFAVTDGQGRFALPPLPPGTYLLEVWHERLGTRTQQIVVEARDAADVTFTYQAADLAGALRPAGTPVEGM